MKINPFIGLKSILRLFSLLSLDVVLGSIASCLLVQHLTAAVMPLAWWLIVPMALWSIYTADHLLDVKKSAASQLQARHYFHHKYRKVLSTLVFVFGISSALLAFRFLPPSLIWMGLILGGLCMLYFFLLQKNILPTLIFHKEFLVALIYTIGIWGGPLLLAYPKHSFASILLMLAFLYNAYINLLIFSYYEYQADWISGDLSLAHFSSAKFVKVYIHWMVFISLLLATFVLISSAQFTMASGILMLMSFAHLMILRLPRLFQKNNIYRPAAEAVFFLPLLLILKQ